MLIYIGIRCTTKIPSLNLRLKHNQQLIMKYIMTHREEIIDRAFNQAKYGFEPSNPLGVSAVFVVDI